MHGELNDRQRRFADGVLQGMSLTAAYQAAHPNYSGISARKYAWELRQKPQVKAYMEAVRRETKMEAVMSRQEILEYLTAIIRTPVGELDEFHPLCTSIIRSSGATAKRMPDKIRAIDRLCRMMGWYEPEKVQVESDGLMDLIEWIRAGAPRGEEGETTGRE